MEGGLELVGVGLGVVGVGLGVVCEGGCVSLLVLLSGFVCWMDE